MLSKEIVVNFQNFRSHLFDMALICGLLIALVVSDVTAFTNGPTNSLLGFGRSMSLMKSQRTIAQSRVVPMTMTMTAVNLAEVGDDIIVLPSESGIIAPVSPDGQHKN